MEKIYENDTDNLKCSEETELLERSDKTRGFF
jgi:hypothetical protein